MKTEFITAMKVGFQQTKQGVVLSVLSGNQRWSYLLVQDVKTLLYCSASGIACDPLIIFKGQNFMTSWFGENALPNTYYGHSENSCMDSVAFAKWFKIFAETLKDRPLLLIFDGHITHITIPVITRALKENITILKIPPHSIDLLQPLDNMWFGPLKWKWETVLGERMTTFGSKLTLSKGEFLNLLCSIWNERMTESNIQSGFSATGIWPLDRGKYHANRFDPRLLQKYKE